MSKNIKLLELGNKIRLERMKRDMSQEKLAELANVSIRTISDIERGITDIRYTNLIQIASAFELSTSKLLDFHL
ncbi:helix-turn-helix transcriptional regulator [bacterium]|nr:helix-turn-helix transcriptional regulator [bacterium]